MCYTTDEYVKPKTEVTYSAQFPYGSDGYRTNCNNIPVGSFFQSSCVTVLSVYWTASCQLGHTAKNSTRQITGVNRGANEGSDTLRLQNPCCKKITSKLIDYGLAQVFFGLIKLY